MQKQLEGTLRVQMISKFGEQHADLAAAVERVEGLKVEEQ